MKIEEELQRSQELASPFAKYREEAPLLSSSEVEQLLASRAMLPNPSRNIIRNSIMTLAGLTGIGAIAYFAFFSIPHANNVIRGMHLSRGTNQSYRSDPTDSSHQTFKQVQTPLVAKQLLPQPATERGPWSAGNDQFYADLSPEELARIGLVISNDTVLNYVKDDKGAIRRGTLMAHSIGGNGITTSVPAGVRPLACYPLLMTMYNGHAAFWRAENGWGSVGDNEMINALRAWLQKPAAPGYYVLGFTRTQQFFDDKTHERRDSVFLSIGKDFPKPRLMPLMKPDIDGYSDTVMQALLDLALYYDGNGQKPTIAWPKTLHIVVDTTTPSAMLNQMDSEENSSTMQRLHSIMARLNELVPVIVHMTPGHGKPNNNDFIFWYEPSEELFNALPPAQAAIFRKSKAPHCMNAPAAVTASAEVTYCVSEPQQVQVRVFDLTGHVVMSITQQAESGNNVAQVDTRSLPSGMYIVSVQDKDGSERTRRIWVQNAHPTR